MTYFADLTPYVYRPESTGEVNIGWLDAAHPFDIEPPSEELLDALWQRVKNAVHQSRGIHRCDRCERPADYNQQLDDVKERRGVAALTGMTTEQIAVQLPWPRDPYEEAIRPVRHGEQLLIGTAEIRVFGQSGTVYAAPTLIYHYVAVHHYKPPSDFVWGLFHGPRPE